MDIAKLLEIVRAGDAIDSDQAIRRVIGVLLNHLDLTEKRYQDGIKAGQDETLETSKTGRLLDALKLIRQTIRNSRTAPNVIDTVDYIAMKAILDFFEMTK